MKPSFRWLFLAVLSLLLVNSALAHYDPRTGRWLSRDPIGEAGGLNLYAYCGNDPVNRHDPLGLAVFDGTAWADEQNQVWLVGWKFDSNGFLGMGRGAQFGKRKIGTLVEGNFVQFSSAIQAAGGNYITGMPLSMMHAFATAQGRWINKQSTLSTMGAGGAGDTLQRNLIGMMLAAKSGANVAGYFSESPTARTYAAHYSTNTVGAIGGMAMSAGGTIGTIPSGGTSLAATWYGADVAGTSLHNLAAGPDGSLPTVTNQMLAQMMPQPWANRTEMVIGAGLGARVLVSQMPAMSGWHNAANARYTWGVPSGGHWTQGVGYQLRSELNLIGSGKELHHWLIPQGGWGASVPNYIKNRMWNLRITDSAAHHALIDASRRVPGVVPYPLFIRPWMAMPNGAKGAATATGVGIGYGLSNDD
jgi:hypothetical protein